MLNIISKGRFFEDGKSAALAGRIQHTKERKFIEERVKVPIHKFAGYNSFLDVGCSKVWAAFRACHLKASVLLSTELLVTGKGKGEDDNVLEQKTAQSRELHRLLTSPNPYDSFAELEYMWAYHMELTGNAYWLKDEINSLGQPKNLYPLLPQYIYVIPHATDKVERYVYKVNGQEIPFSPEEIIHFRRPHPKNLTFGLGHIEPAQDLYSGYISRNSYEEKFLKHGAMPSGILTYKGTDSDPATLDSLDPEQWNDLKRKWQAEYGGRENAGRTAFLTGDWAYTRMGLTQAEMQSLERERATIEEIFINHGVPLSIAGIKDAANYATARQDDINFRRFEIVPMLDIFVGKLNSEGCLITNFNEGWELGYELSGLVDVEQVSKDYTFAVNSGAMTLNEFREKIGLPKADDPLLDQHFVDGTRKPIELAGTESPGNMALSLLQRGVGKPTAPPAHLNGNEPAHSRVN